MATAGASGWPEAFIQINETMGPTAHLQNKPETKRTNCNIPSKINDLIFNTTKHLTSRLSPEDEPASASELQHLTNAFCERKTPQMQMNEPC